MAASCCPQGPAIYEPEGKEGVLRKVKVIKILTGGFGKRIGNLALFRDQRIKEIYAGNAQKKRG